MKNSNKSTQRAANVQPVKNTRTASKTKGKISIKSTPVDGTEFKTSESIVKHSKTRGMGSSVDIIEIEKIQSAIAADGSGAGIAGQGKKGLTPFPFLAAKVTAEINSQYCEPEVDEADFENKHDLLKTITYYFDTLAHGERPEITTSQWLDANFTKEELCEHNIFTSGDVRGFQESKELFLLGDADLSYFGSYDAKMYSIKMYDQARLKIDVGFCENLMIHCHGSNVVKGFAGGNTYVDMYVSGSSKVKLHLAGFAKTNITSYENSEIFIVQDKHTQSEVFCRGKIVSIDAKGFSNSVIRADEGVATILLASNEQSRIGLISGEKWNGDTYISEKSNNIYPLS